MTAANIKINLRRADRSPKPSTSSSPRDIKSSLDAKRKRIGKNIISHGARSLISSQFLPHKLPVTQIKAALTSPGNLTIIYCMPAWQTAPKAIPTNAIVEGLAFFLRTNIINNTATRPSSGKCRQRQNDKRRSGENQDDDHRRQAGALRYSNNIGGCKRISDHPLQNRTRNAKTYPARTAKTTLAMRYF